MRAARAAEKAERGTPYQPATADPTHVARAREALGLERVSRIGRYICPHGGDLLGWVVRTPAGLVYDPAASRKLRRDVEQAPMLLDDGGDVVGWCAHGVHVTEAGDVRRHFLQTKKSLPGGCVPSSCTGSPSYKYDKTFDLDL
jgi:hypothetical protein